MSFVKLVTRTKHILDAIMTRYPIVRIVMKEQPGNSKLNLGLSLETGKEFVFCQTNETN